jgi:hypothetical protein
MHYHLRQNLKKDIIIYVSYVENETFLTILYELYDKSKYNNRYQYDYI